MARGGRRRWAFLACVAVGAFAGPALSQSDNRGDIPFIRQALNDALDTLPAGQEATWGNPSTGNRGTIRPLAKVPGGPGGPCRAFQRTWVFDGGVSTFEGFACRDERGIWRVQEDRLVGRVALAPSGAGPAVRPPPVPARQPDPQVQEAQTLLAKLGVDVGTADGIAGPRTTNALRTFQLKENLPADGQPGTATLDRLRQAAAASSAGATANAAPVPTGPAPPAPSAPSPPNGAPNALPPAPNTPSATVAAVRSNDAGAEAVAPAGGRLGQLPRRSLLR